MRTTPRPGPSVRGATPSERRNTTTKALPFEPRRAARHNMLMPLYRDAAIVLRTHKLGESDRIITLLTRNHGKVRAVAKGVRKTTSKFGSRLEPATVVDVQLNTGRNLETVTQVDILAPYGDPISQNYPAFTACAAMLETADRLCEDAERVLAQFNLLAGALATLTQGRIPAHLVLDAYLVRAVATAGWTPSFIDCAGCGAPGPHRHFNVAAGGAVCPDCRAPGSSLPAPSTFILMDALLTGDWVAVAATDDATRRQSSALIGAYVQWHTEHGVRSLRLVDRGETELTGAVRHDGSTHSM